MTIYNLDDQPLQFNSVKATTPQYELVARFTSDSDYYLLYVNPYANSPRYDLANFKENVPENVVSLKIGQASQVNSVEEISNFFIPTSAL